MVGLAVLGSHFNCVILVFFSELKQFCVSIILIILMLPFCLICKLHYCVLCVAVTNALLVLLDLTLSETLPIDSCFLHAFCFLSLLLEHVEG